jgi:hypothetical protein
MRLRKFLTCTALISLALIIPQAAPSPAPVAAVTPSPVSDNSMDAKTNVVLASAYIDTLSILSTNNGCSAFFGGPRASMDIFNQLLSRVRKKLENRHEPEIV